MRRITTRRHVRRALAFYEARNTVQAHRWHYGLPGAAGTPQGDGRAEVIRISRPAADDPAGMDRPQQGRKSRPPGGTPQG